MNHCKFFLKVKNSATCHPKTALAAVQVCSAVARGSKDRASEAVDFILNTVDKMESEKHSMALKELLALTTRYPSLLTSDVVAKVSHLEVSGLILRLIIVINTY